MVSAKTEFGRESMILQGPNAILQPHVKNVINLNPERGDHAAMTIGVKKTTHVATEI